MMKKLLFFCLGMVSLGVGASLPTPAEESIENFKEVSVVARISHESEELGLVRGSAVPFRCDQVTKDLFTIYLLTAKHLVENPKNIIVEFFTIKVGEHYLFGKEVTRVFFGGVLVEVHKKLDVAIIKVQSHVELPVLQLSYVPPHCMEKVFASGSPLGTPTIVTEGRVMRPSTHEGWVCTAPIAPGNSGGAVISQKTRKLIGISSFLNTIGPFGNTVPHMHGFVPTYEFYGWVNKTLQK